MNQHFSLTSRILHWIMAVLILAMLFIGVAMVSSLSDYHRLVSVHKPIGILILVLAGLRLVNRFIFPPPPLPSGMPVPLRVAAEASHWLLYALMFVQPLVGWAMLSAAGYPIALIGAFSLPPIVPHDMALYSFLRPLHSVLAFALFATFLLHLAAALTHALIFRDSVFKSMTH